MKRRTFIEGLGASRSDVGLRSRDQVIEPACLRIGLNLPIPRIVEINLG